MKNIYICDDANDVNFLKNRKITEKDRIFCFDKTNLNLTDYKFNFSFPFDELYKSKNDATKNYFDFLEKNISNRRLLNYSRIGECNFADKYIIQYYKLFLINKLISCKNTNIILVSNSIKKNYLMDFGFTKIISIKDQYFLNFYQNPKKKMILIKNIFQNLFKEVSFNFFKKRKKKKLKKNIIYSHIKHHWSLNKKNQLNYTYIKNIKELFFIVSALRNNSQKLLKIKKNKILDLMQNNPQFEILENYSSFKSILKAYFLSIFFLYKIKVKKNLPYSNFFIDYLKDSFIIDCSKQLSFQYTLRVFFSENHVSKICIPTFEFSEGRTVLSEAKKNSSSQILAMQHGFMGDFHLNRFTSSYNLNLNNKNFYPDKIILFGEIYNKYLKRFNSENIIIGNTRIIKLPERYRFKETKKIKYLLLLDLHNWRRIIDEMSHISDIRNIYIKAHPFTQKSVHDYVHSKKINVNFFDSNYKEEDFNCVLCSDSGVAIEYALSGWPVFLIKNNYFVNYSPLLLDNKNFLSFDFNVHEIKKISLLLNSKINLQNYVDNLEKKAKLHCSYFGADAEIKLKSLLN